MTNSLKTVRRLIIFLVISGSLNILLIATFFYLSIKERPPTPYFELKPAKTHEEQAPLAIEDTDSQVIRQFRRMPMNWLVSRLSNSQLVEHGYTQRDLALASLVTFHNFDLDRALTGLSAPEQKRFINYGTFRDGTPAQLTVYPGLSDKHFSAIIAFAETEQWPLTAKGLFLSLQKEDREHRDPSLIEAFQMRSDFNVVEMLFNRSGQLIDKDELMTIILDGEWSQLASFVNQQRISQDLSAARRQSFILSYVQKKSRAAARLMLKTDGIFAARKLDDVQVLQLLELIEEKSPEGEQFALLLLTSPRSDAVWKLAAERLYQYAGEPIPEKYTHRMVLSRFVPEQVIIAAAPSPAVEPVVPLPQPPPQPSPTPKPIVSPPKPVVAPSLPRKPLPTKLEIAKQVPPKVAARTLPTATPPQKRAIFYVVQEGDSLWKISRRFNVDVEVIRVYNQLDSDLLSPGRTLKIPKK